MASEPQITVVIPCLNEEEAVGNVVDQALEGIRRSGRSGEVLVVDRGAAAVGAIARFTPDLVVLDIGLPDMPGTVVFEHIRRDSPDLPVLFSTGHAGEIEGAVSGMRGPTGHLLKPYDMTTLLNAIRLLVE